MKYIVDYEFTKDVTCYTVNNEIIFDCFFDERPLGTLTYINVLIKNEKGEILNESIENDINFTNFIMNYKIKKGFIIEQICSDEENVYNLYNDKGDLIDKDLVHRAWIPKISLDGIIDDKF